jgi:hypothetical protein
MDDESPGGRKPRKLQYRPSIHPVARKRKTSNEI